MDRKETTMLTASRYHDISCGHRVVGHENKCALLHGHNYRVHFTCSAPNLDQVGRVIDFSVMKSKLCMWLEDNWDHKFLAWEEDGLVRSLLHLAPRPGEDYGMVLVPFNPTAENIAKHLLHVIGPQQLEGTGVQLIHVEIEETRKCKAAASLE